MADTIASDTGLKIIGEDENWRKPVQTGSMWFSDNHPDVAESERTVKKRTR